MLIVVFFDCCELLLEFRMDIESVIMQAGTFSCRNLVFVAVNNGSSAKLGKRKANHAYNDDCGFFLHGLHHC